ncbi:hypothetical protein [Bradyrhizobium sp. S3.14.4]
MLPIIDSHARPTVRPISVPLVPQLLDGVKYMEHAPPREIKDLRRLRLEPAKPRAPTIRAMVKLAMQCADAEELGHRLRQRYERQQRRQGAADRNEDSQHDPLWRGTGIE